jgi:hypothetical protein
LALPLIFSPAAFGERVTLTFSGVIEVQNADDLLPADIVSGLPFVGSLTYDTSEADLSPESASIGTYSIPGFPTSGFEVSIGLYTFATDSSQLLAALSASVGNNYSSTGPALLPDGDSLKVSGTLPGTFADTSSIVLDLRDPTGVVFETDALPSAFSATAFGFSLVTIEGLGAGTHENGPTFFQIAGHIDSLAIAIVPEPSSAVVCAIGVVVYSLFRHLAIRR